MAKSRTELLNARLRDLQASSGDVEAAAIVSVDGLSIASSLPAGYEEDRVSAMSAAMLSLGERIATELGRGSLQQVYVKGADGYVVLFAVGEEAVLPVLTRKDARRGLSFLDVARPVQDLAQLL
ncbi:MAG: roadblock/LC7 domain-containing protein [Chloroflexi bacterium]|nr:roadblock/LC7 domain-containing protein [Chloroflexota bacterium]